MTSDETNYTFYTLSALLKTYRQLRHAAATAEAISESIYARLMWTQISRVSLLLSKNYVAIYETPTNQCTSSGSKELCENIV